MYGGDKHASLLFHVRNYRGETFCGREIFVLKIEIKLTLGMYYKTLTDVIVAVS